VFSSQSTQPFPLSLSIPVLPLSFQSGRLCQALRGRVNELEAELAEQSHLRMQASGESEFLRAELDDLRRVREDTEKEQRSLTEIESKEQGGDPGGPGGPSYIERVVSKTIFCWPLFQVTLVQQHNVIMTSTYTTEHVPGTRLDRVQVLFTG